MPRDHPTPAPDSPARRRAAEVKMVGYITTAHDIAQRLSEKWRHFVVHCLYSLFCTSPRCVGVACTSTDEKNTTPARRRAPAALGCPRRRHAQCTSRNSALTSHRSLALWRWILVRDVSFGARRGSFFLCGVEQTPVFVWRVVVVGGLCARRRKCKFGVVTGRVAVNSRRSDVTSNPL